MSDDVDGDYIRRLKNIFLPKSISEDLVKNNNRKKFDSKKKERFFLKNDLSNKLKLSESKVTNDKDHNTASKLKESSHSSAKVQAKGKSVNKLSNLSGRQQHHQQLKKKSNKIKVVQIKSVMDNSNKVIHKKN